MRVSVRIFDADEQGWNAAQFAREWLDERDRSAAADGERRPTKALFERAPGRFERRMGRIRVPPTRARFGMHLDLDAPRRLRLQMRDELAFDFFRVEIRNDADADARPRRFVD